MLKNALFAASIALIAAVLPKPAEAQFYGRNGNVVGGRPFYYGYVTPFSYPYGQPRAYATPYNPGNTYPPANVRVGASAPVYVSPPGAAYVPNTYYAPNNGFFGPQYRRFR